MAGKASLHSRIRHREPIHAYTRPGVLLDRHGHYAEAWQVFVNKFGDSLKRNQAFTYRA